MSLQNNQGVSHPHVLHNLRLDEEKPISCNACEEEIISTESFHGCSDCSFHLHNQCFNAPLHLQHPSHTSHPLTLLPNPPTDTSQSYICDACGYLVEGYCYDCSPCDYNIHLRCANLPLSLLIDDHEHELKLFLTDPYNGDVNFQCDLCQGIKESKLWSFYCQECDFGIHVGCAMKFKDATESTSMPLEELAVSASLLAHWKTHEMALKYSIQTNKLNAKIRKNNMFGWL